jgi:hypothetical protein
LLPTAAEAEFLLPVAAIGGRNEGTAAPRFVARATTIEEIDDIDMATLSILSCSSN